MSAAGPRPLPDFAQVVLGRDTAVHALDGLAECRQAVASLARQFVSSLEIVTRDLDPRLYDDAGFVDSVRTAVVASRRTRVRILVRDPGPAVRAGHRLVGLALRLTTFIEIRVPAREHADYNEAFLIADGTGSVHRQLADRYEATACFASRSIAGNLLREFEGMWLPAHPHPDLRRLHV